MLRRTNKYIPVMLNSARPKKSGWKTAFLVLLGIVALVVAVLIIGNQKQPFSTITPTTTPAETVSASPDSVSANAPAEPDGETDSQDGQGVQNGIENGEESTGAINPVETFLFAYREAYQKSESRFAAVAKAHSLRMLSFKLALTQANGTVEDICSYFTGLEKGETPGEWGNGGAVIKAAGGNYSITASFNTGARIEGKISSTMTRTWPAPCSAPTARPRSGRSRSSRDRTGITPRCGTARAFTRTPAISPGRTASTVR